MLLAFKLSIIAAFNLYLFWFAFLSILLISLAEFKASLAAKDTFLDCFGITSSINNFAFCKSKKVDFFNSLSEGLNTSYIAEVSEIEELLSNSRLSSNS